MPRVLPASPLVPLIQKEVFVGRRQYGNKSRKIGICNKKILDMNFQHRSLVFMSLSSTVLPVPSTSLLSAVEPAAPKHSSLPWPRRGWHRAGPCGKGQRLGSPGGWVARSSRCQKKAAALCSKAGARSVQKKATQPKGCRLSSPCSGVT